MGDNDFPCSDERCAVYIHEVEPDDPHVCIHHDNNAEAIQHWGEVARDEKTVDDVIEPYREYLDFDEATSLDDHYDTENAEWTGPTVEIEVRLDGEPIETFTAYPHGRGTFPGFEDVKLYAEGVAEGLLKGTRHAEGRAK